jgi:hypothetical protein
VAFNTKWASDGFMVPWFVLERFDEKPNAVRMLLKVVPDRL